MSSTIKGAQIRDETIETNDIKDNTIGRRKRWV